MIHETTPAGFSPKFEVVSCYMMCKGKLLLVQRNDDDSEGGRWAFPGGKVEVGETLKGALVREMKEETGISLFEKEFTYLKTLYVEYPSHDFVYHIFYIDVPVIPKIILNKDEHKGYLWMAPSDSLGLNLVTDGKDCVNIFIGLIQKFKNKSA